MSNRQKKTDIDSRTRQEVHRRDGYRCVYCGRTDKPIELAHYISRSQGGLGVPQNLISLCIDCHRYYDGNYRNDMKGFFTEYLKSAYADWSEDKIIFTKD